MAHVHRLAFSPWLLAALLGAASSCSSSTGLEDGGAPPASPDSAVASDAGQPSYANDASDSDASDSDASDDQDAGTGLGQDLDGSLDDRSVVPATRFCDLPGAVRFTVDGKSVVPGGTGADAVSFLGLPAGFCAHYYGRIPDARQMRFAPGGELFVASPTFPTTGGGLNGKAAILILPDDDGDGVGDLVHTDAGEAPITFLSNLPSTQGMLFSRDGHFYYQDGTAIFRRPYTKGDRAPAEPSEMVANITFYSSSVHWPKVMDQADDGTIYVGNGGDQGESCDATDSTDRPFHGGILVLDGSEQGAQIAKGFRNPIAIRCPHGRNLCLAAELAQDYTETEGGREKLVPIRKGDDWGFPCCLTAKSSAPSYPLADCSSVVAEDVSFVIGDTPFGFDFEPGKWGAPYTGSVFLATHGAASSWKGARVVAITIDPSTGMPMRGSNLPDEPMGAMTDFATGWDDGRKAHGRPAAITFARDGRMFVANDNDGLIFWVAPIGLER